MAKWMSDEWLKSFYPENEFVEVKKALTKPFLKNVKKFQEIKSVTELPSVIESFYKEYDSYNKMEKFLTCSLVAEIDFFKDRSDGKELWEEYLKNYKNFLWVGKTEKDEEPAKYGFVPISIKYGLEITNEQYPLVAASKNKEDVSKTSDESSTANDDQKGNEQTGNDQNGIPDGNKA